MSGRSRGDESRHDGEAHADATGGMSGRSRRDESRHDGEAHADATGGMSEA
jgi:hypothetical protein